MRAWLLQYCGRSLWLALLVGQVGCGVTVYQPMRGLSRPVVLQHAPNNFSNMRILVRCISSEDLPPADASKVCRNLATTFRAQGAESETVVPRSRREQSDGELFEGKKPDLTIQLESKTEHEQEYPLIDAASVLTLTIIPSVDERTFVQKITVYGADRSVLATDFYRARFVRYEGVAVWGINWLLDQLVREEADKMTGDVAKKDFSKDFYRQTSQLAFNARIRAEILGITPSAAERAAAQKAARSTKLPGL